MLEEQLRVERGPLLENFKQCVCVCLSVWWVGTCTNAHSGEITVLQSERNNSGGCGCTGQEVLQRRKATEDQPDQRAGSELQKPVLSDLSALSRCADHGRGLGSGYQMGVSALSH